MPRNDFLCHTLSHCVCSYWFISIHGSFASYSRSFIPPYPTLGDREKMEQMLQTDTTDSCPFQWQLRRPPWLLKAGSFAQGIQSCRPVKFGSPPKLFDFARFYGSNAHLGRLFRSLRTTFFMLTSGLAPWGTHL